MSAPNLTALFDFEGQFEAAAQAVMTANGITSFVSQQADKLPPISTGIGFDLGPAIDELTQIPAPTNWPTGQAAPQEYFRYTGTLEIRVEVPRDQESSSVPGVENFIGELRGKVRAAMMLTVMPFSPTNLPWLRVSDIRPNGTSTGWDQPRNVDFCSLRFAITFAIQPGAWPAWIES